MLYLHSTPYSVAPAEQTRVPMVLWFSKRWQQNEKTDLDCLRQRAATGQYSHDNLFHTVLGLLDMDLASAGYRQPLDILAACRR